MKPSVSLTKSKFALGSWEVTDVRSLSIQSLPVGQSRDDSLIW